MRQIKAEIYKLKFSKASKWIAVFMLFIAGLPLILGNDTLFMTFGDYQNMESIGWICYIHDFTHIHFEEMARFALSINFFSWIGFLVYITAMIAKEYQLGTLAMPVVYGVNKTRLLFYKLLVLNAYFFGLYFVCETTALLALGIRYQYSYTVHEVIAFWGMVFLNAFAMVGLEIFAVLLTILIKSTGIVMAASCVWFFAGAISYPMVYENIQDQSILIKIFCAVNPTTYMYNICGYRMSTAVIYGTIAYVILSCCIGAVLFHLILKGQEL